MVGLHPQQSANSPELERLVRLEGYLQSDPANVSLLADAFDTAMHVGLYDVARRFVERAERLVDELPEQRAHWQFRRASLCMATHDDLEAERLLEDLIASGEIHPAIACNMAQLSYRRAAYEEVLERLQPLLDTIDESVIDQVRVLALRSWHRLGQVTQALEWFDTHVPGPDGVPAASATVMGIASLLALDAQRMADTKTWSEIALAGDDSQMEALVARASIALADDDSPLARQLFDRALRNNENDGRTWSGVAFADLLEMQLDLAETHFRRSLQTLSTHIGTWHGLAWTCLLQHKLEQAQAAFNTALEIDRNFAESHGGVAVVAALLGNRAASEESIARALRLDPQSLAARYAQAILDGEANDPQAMATLARRLLRAQSRSSAIRLADRLGPPLP